MTIGTGAQTVAGGAEVSLTATASDSEDADSALTFAWTGQGTFDDAAAKDTTWTAPTRLTSVQSILLTVTVTDTGGLKALDTVVMTVSANSLPEVEITSDFQDPVDGNAEVQIFANASDPDNDDLTYQWSVEPNKGSFDDDETLDTTWTAPDAASTDQAYTLSLTVEDTGGLQGWRCHHGHCGPPTSNRPSRSARLRRRLTGRRWLTWQQRRATRTTRTPT